jgi:hypothetical protein
VTVVLLEAALFVAANAPLTQIAVIASVTSDIFLFIISLPPNHRPGIDGYGPVMANTSPTNSRASKPIFPGSYLQKLQSSREYRHLIRLVQKSRGQY